MSDKEAYAEAKAARAKAKALRPWYLKKRNWVLAFIAISIVASALSSKNSPTTDVVASSQISSSSDNSVSSNSSESGGQRNARNSAKDYLSSSAFSRSGLIKQLEFGGFSTSDATYGVDAVNADWNDQAAKSAKDYLDSSAFSESGLVKQLEFSGFTTVQATFGVNAQNAFHAVSSRIRRERQRLVVATCRGRVTSIPKARNSGSVTTFSKPNETFPAR
ncbi:MAG: Ltp family lipoprotein [Actinobacteria bacterium]|nr:Ltp family lipoprotein [Actinomycetota bacterium]